MKKPAPSPDAFRTHGAFTEAYQRWKKDAPDETEDVESLTDDLNGMSAWRLFFYGAVLPALILLMLAGYLIWHHGQPPR